MSIEDEVIDLTVGFHGDGSEVNITISGFTDYQHVISALRKIGQTDYLLALYDGLRGINIDDDEEGDWDE